MAEKAKKDAGELCSIELLQRENKISAPVMAGVMAQQGWRRGREVSRADFLAALKKFLSGKVGG